MKNQFIKKLAEILEIDEESITMDCKFRELENWDSLASLSLSAMINEDFDLVIPKAEFAKLYSVEDIINYIESNK